MYGITCFVSLAYQLTTTLVVCAGLEYLGRNTHHKYIVDARLKYPLLCSRVWIGRNMDHKYVVLVDAHLYAHYG